MKDSVSFRPIRHMGLIGPIRLIGQTEALRVLVIFASPTIPALPVPTFAPPTSGRFAPHRRPAPPPRPPLAAIRPAPTPPRAALADLQQSQPARQSAQGSRRPDRAA